MIRLALPCLILLGLSACGLQDLCINIGSGCPSAKPQEEESRP
jgi:hypothetical protein